MARYRTLGPVDPIDPFRGSYVELSYPGLPTLDSGGEVTLGEGEVFVPLVADRATGLWRGNGVVPQRPAGPYLACHPSRNGSLSCGIDSLFVPAQRARRIERELMGDRAAAVLRIDRDGHAALMGVEPR